MSTITTHLWFDQEAEEAAHFYTSVFDQSKILQQNSIDNTPSGKVDILVIELYGQQFTLISAGPYFKFNPSTSFFIYCSSKEEVEMYWQKLSEKGSVLMELGEYPFSEKYGWLQDKYGLSWQIFYTGGAPITQKIIPSLMFVGNNAGKAEEAMNFYTSIFPDSKSENIYRYGPGKEPDNENNVMFESFELNGKSFAAMDSAWEHKFAFNEAVSFMINCDDQKEIDYYWEKLSAVPQAEQCGWLKDKYGLSWQVVPTALGRLLSSGDQEKKKRVTAAFMKMKKLNISELENA